MISGVYNFTLDQGATFTRTITVKNPDDSLYDLTGYTARMHIRRDYSSDTIMLSLTTENNRITLGDDAGTIDLVVSATDTATLDRDGVYDLELVDGSTVYRLLRGSVKVNLEVTR